MELPTAVTFTPDGEMLAASQTGRLWRIEDGRLVATPVLDLSGRLCPRLEQGLLGVAVHPRYESTRWIYVFWTHDVEGCVHRVSRFTVRPDGVADPGSERVLVDRIPSPNGDHNGGDLHCGPDGYHYDCGTIFRLQPTDDGDYQELVFVDVLGASSAVHMVFGPSPFGQSLYYTTYAAGGQIRRLDHIGAADRPPVSELRASPLHGPTPLTVRLDAGASRAFGAPDRLRYRFDFGDDTGLLDTPAAVVEHTYHAEGPHTASVVAEDSQGRRSGPATVVIHPGESPPVPSITGPDRRYGVGDPVRIEGTATDAQDGAVPPERLTWRVLLHHEDHTHPFLGPLTGTKLGFDFPRPESLRAAATSWREVRLTATDKAGLDATAVFEVRPRMVQLTFDTEPDGLRLLIDGRAETAPCTVASWPGLPVRLEAPDQDRDGKRFRFRRWSDGGARDHTIETPDEPTTWTATFRR